MALLLDTHTWIWSLLDDAKLPRALYSLILADAPCYVSAGSLYEIAYKARLGRWPEVAAFTHRLLALASEQGVRMVDIDGEIAVRAAQLAWAHRDPFDRFIVATAISRHLPLVSADAQFDDLATLPDWPGRLW